MLLQAIWSKYATKMEGEDEAIYYHQVYKKNVLLCQSGSSTSQNFLWEN